MRRIPEPPPPIYRFSADRYDCAVCGQRFFDRELAWRCLYPGLYTDAHGQRRDSFGHVIHNQEYKP